MRLSRCLIQSHLDKKLEGVVTRSVMTPFLCVKEYLIYRMERLKGTII